MIVNDVLNGKILLYGKTAVGLYPSNTHIPVVASELWGAIALANSYTVDVQSPNWISNPSLSSYVKVVNPITNDALELDIADGNIDGQLLIIEGNQNPFTLKGQGAFNSNNVYGADIIIGGGDVLTLIWNATREKWMPMAFKDN